MRDIAVSSTSSAHAIKARLPVLGQVALNSMGSISSSSLCETPPLSFASADNSAEASKMPRDSLNDDHCRLLITSREQATWLCRAWQAPKRLPMGNVR
jgi:hypothetical protein